MVGVFLVSLTTIFSLFWLVASTRKSDTVPMSSGRYFHVWGKVQGVMFRQVSLHIEK